MTTWHWVRHGPTHQKAFVGWRDVPADLSDTAQIARLRAHLPAEALLVSSDLVRATATADAVSGDGHRRLPHEPDLREIHFGAWDGMHFSDVAARDPELSRLFWEQPGDISAPEGESWNRTSLRVEKVVQRISAEFPGKHIIAVAHFGVILTQLQRALQVAPYDTLAQPIDNLSVTSITREGGNGNAGVINHLP